MILNGWKQIAAHLGRGVRTVQRWESLGLPVRRPRRKDRSAVTAFSEELDDWVRSAPRLPKSEDTQAASSKPSSAKFPARILLVDSDENLLVTAAALLLREGYDVRTARDGFEALTVLRGSIPDLLVSELKLPNMSGFELLGIVRKRFPAMAVIAMSSEFAPVTSPVVVADRYLQKGKNSDAELKKVIRELLSGSPLRAQLAKHVTGMWVPRSTNGYVILNCPECLRTFSVSVGQLELDKTAVEQCLHCGQDVSYFISSAAAATDVLPPSILNESNARIRKAKAEIQQIKSP